MATIENIITENIDVWSSAIKQRNTQGRGSSKKQELYGIQKLRELILELAVRGLLVPQNPNDEPALIGLDSINNDQGDLLNSKNKKIKQLLSKVKEEDKLFFAPMSWFWTRLGEIGETNIGLTYKPANIADNGTPVLRSSNVQKRKICLKDLVRVTGVQLKNNVLVKEGDLLICVRNGSKSLVGKTAMIKNLTEPTVFGAFMAIYRCEMNSFIEVFLNSPVFRRALVGVDTTTINQITQSNLKSTVIALPPLKEQKRIVAKVDELMALCDQLEQQQENSIAAHQQLVETLLAALTQAADNESFEQAWSRIAANFDTLFTTENSIDQLKQTLLQLAVMGKLVPQDPSDEPASAELEKLKEKYSKSKNGRRPDRSEEIVLYPFQLPSNWTWARFPELGEWGRGKSKHRPRNDRSLFKDGIWPLIQTGDVANANGLITSYNKAYSDFGLEQSKLWPKGTLCITIAANIADSAFLGIDACFPDSVVGLVPDSMFDGGKYFEYFIRTAKQNLTDYAPSTAQKNINLGILEQVNIPFPPVAEQKRIVAKVDQLFAICDQLKTKINTAQQTQLQLADAITSQAIQ